ncbi:hypothetical protein Droror1_Dr00011251 [Drosera rotundifolia]
MEALEQYAREWGSKLRLTEKKKDVVEVCHDAEGMGNENKGRKVVAKLLARRQIFVEVLRDAVMKAWSIWGGVESDRRTPPPFPVSTSLTTTQRQPTNGSVEPSSGTRPPLPCRAAAFVHPCRPQIQSDTTQPTSSDANPR